MDYPIHDHIHTNHEPAVNTVSFRKRDSSAWGTSIDDSMDYSIHDSVGNTESSRKPDVCSSDDHIHTNHEPAGNTVSFRKRDSSAWGICMPSYGGITDTELAAKVLELQHHLAAKKMRFMCSLEMDNSATSLSDDLHS